MAKPQLQTRVGLDKSQWRTWTLKGAKEAKLYISVLLQNGWSFDVYNYTDCVRIMTNATQEPLRDWCV